MQEQHQATTAGDAALGRVAGHARSALGAERAAVLVPGESGLRRVAGEEVGTRLPERALATGQAIAGADVACVPLPSGTGVLCVEGAPGLDADDLALLQDLAALAGDLRGHAQLEQAVEAGLEALGGLLDLRDGSLSRGSADLVALARRVATRLSDTSPQSASGVRDLLREHGLATPATGRFTRRTPSAARGGEPRQALAGAFERLERLPALAEPRNRLLRLLRDPRPSIGEVVATIESDIALVIATLRAANMVAGPRGGVASVRAAVDLVSPRGLEVIVARIPAVDFFERAPAWETTPERFRLHAVAVQRAAERLAVELGHESADELAAAALLHDVGKLVLEIAYAGYPERLQTGGRRRTPEDRLRAEQRELGVDHALVGGVLMRRWGLPNRLAAAIERHHSAEAEGHAAFVRLADLLAHYSHGDAVDPGTLLQAARRVGLAPRDLRSVMYELPGGATTRRRAAEPSPLTPKEHAALRGLAEGKLYKEIAAELGVTTSTIRSHLHAAYGKLGAADRAQAVLIATERGWI
jgi:putative nucleotidyltransferase with HDIG domain